MAELLGFLAGAGMIALVSVLVVAFLRQMGWIQRDAVRLLSHSAALVCLAGAAYLLLALLCRLATYGKIEGKLQLFSLFHGAYMSRMLPALGNPAGVGPVSLAFAWLSHLLGRVLFGQYTFAGVLLAWGIAAASLYLTQLRLRKLTDDKTARDIVFLLLFLPGSVFFLLPGAAPVCLLAVAVLFYVLTCHAKSWKLRFSPTGYGWLLTVCTLLSAAVTVCAAEGRLG